MPYCVWVDRRKEILIAQSPLFLAGIAHVCSAPIRRASQAAVSKPGCLLLDIERMNGTTDFKEDFYCERVICQREKPDKILWKP